MSDSFINRIFFFFQTTAFLLLIMIIVLMIGISRMLLWQQCLFSSCLVPFFLCAVMVYVAGTLMSPYKVEVHDSSVSFNNILRSRTENIPYNRIREIELPRGERSFQVLITDDHGYEHRFLMVGYRISKEIIRRYERSKRKRTI